MKKGAVRHKHMTEAQYSSRAFKAWETRRLYRFESECGLFKPVWKQLPLKKIVSKAKYIWCNVLYHRMSSFPDISFGKGTKYKNGYVSYYHWYDHYIVLAPGQRDYCTLAHELVHAHGREDHDIEFQFQFMKIMSETFRIDPIKMSDAATEYKLSYQPFLA